ncbi:MAG: V-type ATP synthase subunit D [Polyangiaceae bacterium]|jgi:V/A-type H+/Na+-transporting ATPase subunit D
MTTATRSAATRSNLVRLRRRLDQVEKGAALLRKKRESLAAELFELARPAVDVRREIDEQAKIAYRALLEALAWLGRTELRPLGLPTREIRVELVPREVWGIRGIDLASKPSVVRSAAARGNPSGPGDAAPAAAGEQFEKLIERLLEAAPEELFLRRLGEALSHATRLVNTLEQRVAVSMDRELAAMRGTLEEREREEHMRLKRIVSRRNSR